MKNMCDIATKRMENITIFIDLLILWSVSLCGGFLQILSAKQNEIVT